jgi:hypothetical protein
MSLIRFAPFLLLIPAAIADTVVYRNLPGTLPPNVPSLGYQATGVAEFGDLIDFSGSPERYLTSATVLLSNWTYESQWGTGGPGYLQSLQLNIYNVDYSSGTPQPGTLITSVAQTALIPWRPEPNALCTDSKWLAADNNCYSGFAFTVDFDLQRTLVPGEIIYGLAFNTQTYGSAPYGVDGPYNSLNFGVSTTGPSIGSRPFPDTAYVSSVYPGIYTDNGLGGIGFLRQDTNWSPYSAAVSFTATTPEPGTAGLIIGAAMMLWGYRSRRAVR